MIYNHFENPLQTIDYSAYTNKLQKIENIQLEHIIEITPASERRGDQFTLAIIDSYTQKISHLLQKASEEL